MYTQVAGGLIVKGEEEKALQILDRGMEVMKRYPLNYVVQPSYNEVGVMEAIELYYFLEKPEKARAYVVEFLDETFLAIEYFLQSYRGGFLSAQDAESAISTYVHVNDILFNNGDEELGRQYEEKLEEVFSRYQ